MRFRNLITAVALAATLTITIGSTLGQQPDQPDAPAFHPRTHGQSWKDLATDAFTRKDWQDSIYWYRRALEANPRDNHGWYNLACVYMYMDQREKAIDALIAALETGWTDLHHVRTDEDLTGIAEDPRVVAAMDWVEGQEDRTKPANSQRRFFLQTTTGTYLAYLPPDYDPSAATTYPAVIILHGRGSTEYNHGNPLTTAFGREGVIYISVRFPYANIPFIISNGAAGFEAGPPESADEQGTEFGKFALFADGVAAALDDALANFRIDPRRVHVLGHSQGAASALAFAARHPKRVQSCFAHAGFLPENVLTAYTANDARASGVQFIITHCTGDAIVPFSSGQAVVDMLRSVEASVEMFAPELPSHGFAPPVRERAIRWLSETVRGQKE